MNNRTMRVVSLAVLSALVTVFTMFLKIPTVIGYANLGDGVILFGGLLLGPWAALSAAIGSALSDLLLGYALYIPATFVIKGAMGLVSGFMLRKKSATLNRLAVFILCEALMTLGYFAFECLIYGIPAATGSVIPNLLQGAVGVLCAMALSPARRSIERALNLEQMQ